MVTTRTTKQEQVSNFPPLPVKGQKYRQYKKKFYQNKNLHETILSVGIKERTPSMIELVLDESLKQLGFDLKEILAHPISSVKTGGQTPTLNAELPAACSKSSQQPKPPNGVPVIVEACLRYFNRHATDYVGIFRVPGCIERVSKMMAHVEEHPFAWTSINCVDVFMRNHPEFTAHDVSSFLKRFIKSIFDNEPVIAYDCHGPLIELIRNKCPSNLIGEKCRRILGQLLVPARRLLLARLCTFLREFSKHEATTKMNCASLAVCFANLIYPPPGDNEDPTKNRKKLRRAKKMGRSRSTITLFKKAKKIKRRAQSAAEICELMRAEAEKTKLCVAVIRTLIEQSHHVFETQPCKL